MSRQISYARDDNYRTRDHVLDNNTAIASLDLSYTYAVDKQITAETIAGSFLDDSSFTASYDAGNRISTWLRSGIPGINGRESESWNYDDAGNHTSVTRDGTTQSRTHNSSDELTSIDTDATTLDAKGNMTEDARGNKYSYDIDNRIFKVETAAGSTIEMTYDAHSRRVFRKDGTEKTTYLWWGDQECAEHQSQTGQPVIQNDLWAHPTTLNQIVARALEGDKNDIQYYHKNYLDHVYAVSDDNGNILEHYRYTAFGEVEIYSPAGANLATSAIDNPVLWNSRRYDEQTGLHYYKYRHYAPELGRWLSRDPIEEDGGFNLYGFINNDGINRWDYLGLEGGSDILNALLDYCEDPCDRLKRKIARVSKELKRKLQKYNPKTDGQRHPISPGKGGGRGNIGGIDVPKTTKPFSHYRAIKDQQRVLQSHIDNYDQNCPDGLPFRGGIRDLVYEKITKPRGYQPKYIDTNTGHTHNPDGTITDGSGDLVSPNTDGIPLPDGALEGALVGVGIATAIGVAGPQALAPEEAVTVPTGALIGGAIGVALGAFAY